MRQRSTRSIVIIVYMAFVVDNLLLTVVVPVLPEFLRQLSMENARQSNRNQAVLWKINNPTRIPELKDTEKSHNSNISSEWDSFQKLFVSNVSYSGDSKNSFSDGKKVGSRPTFALGRALNVEHSSDGTSLGLLFSSRSIVQLFMNPIAAKMAQANGYSYPLTFGGFALLSSALAYVVSNSFALLVFARSLHGLASSFLTISGLGIIADTFDEEDERGRVIGRVMGGVAVGVLLGYPLGSISYDLTNSKFPPFILITILSALLTGFTMINVGACCRNEIYSVGKASIHELWKDSFVRITGFSILISTSAMAVLEPCLPVWLEQTMKPEKWQLGTAFLPDSIGYLLGTSFGGSLAFQIGRPKMAIMATMLLFTSCMVLPTSSSMVTLAFPHLGLGLGVGCVDASLMPLLAELVDRRHGGAYAAVYSVAQAAVAGAYCIGPLLGSFVASWLGFASTIRMVGMANALFIPYLVYLHYALKEEGMINFTHELKMSPMLKTERRHAYQNLD